MGDENVSAAANAMRKMPKGQIIDMAMDWCDGNIRLAGEVERWRKLYDASPKHPDGLGGNEFISVHNRMVMEWTKENAKLREALGKIEIEILGGDCTFVELSRVKRIGKIARAALEDLPEVKDG